MDISLEVVELGDITKLTQGTPIFPGDDNLTGPPTVMREHPAE
jgi:hypothetical protein